MYIQQILPAYLSAPQCATVRHIINLYFFTQQIENRKYLLLLLPYIFSYVLVDQFLKAQKMCYLLAC